MRMKVLSVTTVCMALALGVALCAAAQQPVAQEGQQSQTAKVAVTEKGFEPATITLKPGVPAKITFVRQTDKTCAKAVSIPAYKINRELPLNEPVVVELTPSKGEFAFTCGMNMLQGKVVVAEK